MRERKGITRRQFLAASMGAGALGALAPFGAAKARPAPSERITVGIIGAGGQGLHNTHGLMGLPDVQVVAVCDVDAAHRQRAVDAVEARYAADTASGAYRGCDAYNDFRDLLARPDIDAVMIATPDHWHGVMSVAAARAGKDIYCEKPLAHSVAEGRAVVDAVRRNGRVLQTGSHERSRDNARYACELVRNGRLGKLRRIQVNMPVDHSPFPNYPPMPVPEGFDYDLWLGPAPWAPYTERRCHFYFRYILDYSGGEITDRGAHILDLAQLAMDADDTGPVRIEAEGWFPPDGLFNTAKSYRFTCTYADGVRIEGSSQGPRGIAFEGDAGRVFMGVHDATLSAEPASLLREVIGPEEVRLGRSRGHLNDFISCVKTRREPMAPAEVGHRTASLCHLLNVAMLRGKALDWDPVVERITNDDRAARMLAPQLRSPWEL